MGASSLAIVLRPSASDEEIAAVVDAANELQTPAYHAIGDGWSAISVGAGSDALDASRFESLDGVERVLGISAPYRLASKELFDDRPIRLASSDNRVFVEVGGSAPLMIAVAPVSSGGEWISPELMVDTVLRVGGNVLGAGEYSTFLSGGNGIRSENQLALICDIAHEAGLLVSVEVADAGDAEQAASHADVLQVSHRSMQDFSLLRELGRSRRPIFMKRGLGATIEEFLLAAEYLLANGNGRVILCEAGIRGSGAGWKPRFEVNAIPLLKQATHLPVVADPSHSSPHPQLLPSVARAAIAAGADGLILEVETDAGEPALEGAMDAETCRNALADLGPVAHVVGRSLSPVTSPSVPRSGNGAVATIVDASVVRPAEPADVLHDTNGTLAAVIERIVETAPHLEVMKQSRISPPYPTWLRWLLRPEGDLLVRWTRYVIDSTVLSRNLSFVDFGRVDPAIIARLEAEELNLGELFSSTEIDKFGFDFGTGVNSGEFDSLLREGHADGKSLHPYLWRRYIAATSGRIGFLVFEALPTLTWRGILNSNGGIGQSTGDGQWR